MIKDIYFYILHLLNYQTIFIFNNLIRVEDFFISQDIFIKHK